MSSDLLSFESSFYSSSEFASSEADLHFFTDSLSPFSDSLPNDFLEFTPNDLIQQTPAQKLQFLDQTVPHCATHLSSSPPSHQLGNLSLSQTTHLQPFTNCSNLPNGFLNFSGLDTNTQAANLSSSYNSTFLPHSISVTHNVAQILQRSYSSKSFGEEPGFFFQHGIDTVTKSPNLQTHLEDSPENAFLSAHMRRVFSTGDLQEIRAPQMTHRSLMERSFVDEAKRYSADERRERIHKYRAKRSQRNFNRTIKYACRKALADNRPRIRGRFARNDEIGDTPDTAILIKDEDDLWIDGFHGEDYEGTVRGGQFLNNFGQTQFQYYGQ